MGQSGPPPTTIIQLRNILPQSLNSEYQKCLLNLVDQGEQSASTGKDPDQASAMF